MQETFLSEAVKRRKICSVISNQALCQTVNNDSILLHLLFVMIMLRAGAVAVFVAVSLVVAVTSIVLVLLQSVVMACWRDEQFRAMLTIIPSRVPPGKVCRQTYAFFLRGGK